jgi:hypothetical protein
VADTATDIDPQSEQRHGGQTPTVEIAPGTHAALTGGSITPFPMFYDYVGRKKFLTKS